MGREKKTVTIIKYKNGVLPSHLAELLQNADENELKVLIGLLMAADNDGVIDPSLAFDNALGLERSVVDAAINFWRGAGVVGITKATKTGESKTMTVNVHTKIEHAHKNGAIEKTVGVVEYRTGELADILENRSEIAVFVDEAQRVVGKTLNMNEIGILVGLIEQYGFETDAILAILAHTTRLGKKGMRYPEKVAISFYDEGLTGGAEVFEKIQRIEASSQTIAKIKELFGIGSRELSTTEKNLFKKWTEGFGYDIEVIRKAYDITIDAIHEPKPKYTNGVLEKWYTERLHTIEDIEKYEETIKGKKELSVSNKSYNINEFFDAALKRSFDDIE